MDNIVTGIFAVFIAIMSLLIAILSKKPIKKILIYTIIGFVFGLAVGYFLTPIIISFY